MLDLGIYLSICLHAFREINLRLKNPRIDLSTLNHLKCKLNGCINKLNSVYRCNYDKLEIKSHDEVKQLMLIRIAIEEIEYEDYKLSEDLHKLHKHILTKSEDHKSLLSSYIYHVKTKMNILNRQLVIIGLSKYS